MHCRTSYVHWHDYYKQVDPSRVVHNYSWVKSLFYPCNYIFHFKYHWFSNEQFVYDPIINKSLSCQWEGGALLFKYRNQYLREQLTYFLYMEGSEFHLMILCFQLPIWSSLQNGRHIESAKTVILTHWN